MGTLCFAHPTQLHSPLRSPTKLSGLGEAIASTDHKAASSASRTIQIALTQNIAIASRKQETPNLRC
jgi:hypothetical protein